MSSPARAAKQTPPSPVASVLDGVLQQLQASGGVYIPLEVVDLCDGNFARAAILSRIIFWFTPNAEGGKRTRVVKDGKDWVAKIHRDWYAECRVPEGTAKRAVYALRDANLIEYTVGRFNNNPAPFVRLNLDELTRRLDQDAQRTIPFRPDTTGQFEQARCSEWSGTLPKVSQSLNTKNTNTTTPKTDTDNNTPTGDLSVGEDVAPVPTAIAGDDAVGLVSDADASEPEQHIRLRELFKKHDWTEKIKAPLLTLADKRSVKQIERAVETVAKRSGVRNPPGLLYDILDSYGPPPPPKPGPKPLTPEEIAAINAEYEAWQARHAMLLYAQSIDPEPKPSDDPPPDPEPIILPAAQAAWDRLCERVRAKVKVGATITDGVQLRFRDNTYTLHVKTDWQRDQLTRGRDHITRALSEEFGSPVTIHIK